MSDVSCRAHDVLPVCSPSIQTMCETYQLDCFMITELQQFLYGACVGTFCVIFCDLKSDLCSMRELQGDVQ